MCDDCKPQVLSGFDARIASAGQDPKYGGPTESREQGRQQTRPVRDTAENEKNEDRERAKTRDMREKLDHARIGLVRSYTPHFIGFTISLYCFPETRERIKFGNISPAESEALDLLKRAGILTPIPNPNGWNSPTNYQIDEDALRVYIDAICNVPLPTKIWKVC